MLPDQKSFSLGVGNPGNWRLQSSVFLMLCWSTPWFNDYIEMRFNESLITSQSLHSPVLLRGHTETVWEIWLSKVIVAHPLVQWFAPVVGICDVKAMVVLHNLLGFLNTVFNKNILRLEAQCLERFTTFLSGKNVGHHCLSSASDIWVNVKTSSTISPRHISFCFLDTTTATTF